MTVQPNHLVSRTTPYFTISFPQKLWVMRAFWLMTAGLITLILVQDATFQSTLGALMILAAALFPIYLWCSGKAKGLPIFPLLSLTFIFTHALPLINNDSRILNYPPEQHLNSALTVTFFLFFSTIIWFNFVKTAPFPPQKYKAFNLQTGENFFLFLLAIESVYNLAFQSGLLWAIGITGGILPIIRAAFILNFLGAFILSYRLGKEELSPFKSKLFVIVLFINVISNVIGLYLNPAVRPILGAIFGYTLGRGKFPWKITTICLVVIFFLNIGKSEMRAKYWSGENALVLAPWKAIPEWVEYSLEELNKPSHRVETGKNSKSEWVESLDRASIVHLLMLIQTRTNPSDIAYLKGETYTIIPEVIVPRVLKPNKIRTQEGNHILTVHYGLGSYEYTLKTSIGWGLLQEAYANFGYLGCVGLSVFYGVLYGQTTRWSMHTHILSFRTIWALLIMSTALQTEFTMGTFVSVVFQGTVVLLAIRYFFMSSYIDKSLHNPHSNSDGFLSTLNHSPTVQ